MSKAIGNIVRNFNDYLTNIRESRQLLEAAQNLRHATAVPGPDASTEELKEFEEMLASLPGKRDELASMHLKVLAAEEFAPVFFELVQVECDHDFTFKGSREDDDYYICNHCGLQKVYDAAVIRRYRRG